MAVFNSIIVGMPWAQIFRLPAGAVDYAGGETLSANFRRNVASPLIFTAAEPASIVRAGNDYNVQLTALETAAFAGFDRISFDLYATKAGATRALGVRVHVPVVNGL